MSSAIPESLKEIRDQIAEHLIWNKRTVCVAETAAGGLVSSVLLSVPGASKFYRGGLTLYTLESRVAFAGWTEENIQNYRGPTEEIVSGLAQNVRTKLGATYCLCESGTAGPTGGNTRNRTPGYAALAVALEDMVLTKEVETGLGGDREANMLAFAEESLKFLQSVMSKDAKL